MGVESMAIAHDVANRTLPVSAARQFAADRRGGIGGSDAAVVTGLSPFRDRLDLWMEKIDHPMWAPQKETEAMRWGKILEPVIAAEYARREHLMEGEFVRTPERVWAANKVQFGSPDGLRLDRHGRIVGIWEGKTASNPSEWLDGVPPWYVAQVQQYAALLPQAEYIDVSVLLPGADFRTYRLDPDIGLQMDIEADVLRFWYDHVVPRIPPDEYIPAAIRAPVPVESEALAVPEGDEIDKLARAALALKQTIRHNTEAYEALVERLREHLERYPEARGAGWRIRYRPPKRTRTTEWEAVATSLWNTLAIVRRFVPDPGPELSPHLDGGLYDVLTGLYTVEGPATRPMYVEDAK